MHTTGETLALVLKFWTLNGGVEAEYLLGNKRFLPLHLLMSSLV